MASKIVKLSSPVMIGDAPVSELSFRPPTAGNYLALGGRPYVWTNAAIEPLIDYEKLTAYLELLIETPNGKAIIHAASIEDAMAMEEAILGFFSKSRPAT
jgi:hypothetical protein